MRLNLFTGCSAAIICLLVALHPGHLRAGTNAPDSTRWPVEKAAKWQTDHPWLVGCNFIPSTAINQLEMWQAETFDPVTIDRELGWAQQLGFNSVRVFLHPLAWQADTNGFINRVERFLQIADKHKIGAVFVLFDSCWNPVVKPGKQPEPLPYTHNSGWVQSPGAEIISDAGRLDQLKPFAQAVIGHFREDHRVDAWDLFNEPDNEGGGNYSALEPKNKLENSIRLLARAFAWAREVNPSQPLTSAVWTGDWSDRRRLSPMARLQLDESDIISFHNYGPLNDARKCVEALRRYHRPLLCTEYMARPQGSTFDPVLGYFHDQRIGAYNWGFVSGKTQTIYPWDSWKKTYTNEPPVWFHDIFQADGTPYRPAEVEYIHGLKHRVASR